VQPGLDPQSFGAHMREKSLQLRARAEALRTELAAVSETVTSPDRLVTVTVGAGGVLRGIAIEPAGLRATPSQWSAAVMRAYGQGCRAVGERAAELVESHTPGSPAATMMREALPPEVDDEPDRAGGSR
jgi:DNA-binding protein YbaB